MSCTADSSDSFYTKYINPLYVTAITSPVVVPAVPSKPPGTSGHDSNLSSTRSCRRRVQCRYVVRRAGVSGSRRAATNVVSSVVKSLQKLKFSQISDATSDLITVPCQSQSHSSIHCSYTHRPASLDDLHTTRTFCELEPSGSLLDIGLFGLNIDDSNSSMNGDSSLNNVEKDLSNFHLAE